MKNINLDHFQSVHLHNGEQGACLVVDNQYAQFKLSLFGAHALSFIPKSDARERLWISENAIFDGKTPIRGGVPICWPWFSSFTGERQADIENYPSHGFVRSQFWKVANIEETNTSSGISSTEISLQPSKLGLCGFDENISVCLKVIVSETLSIQLITSNNSDKPIEITEALHTYFSVPNIHSIMVKGIDEAYYNKVNDSYDNPVALPYCIDKEVDRIHLRKSDTLDESQLIVIGDSDSDSVLVNIEHSGNNAVVVWNPWIDRCLEMKDMASNSYETMLCIEAANTNAITINAGESHIITQMIR